MTTDLVFICYSNKDVYSANEIANSLKNADVNIWIDTIKSKVDEEIEEAIKSAKLFLVITSNNALTDETLKQEKAFARANNIERLLIKIEPCDTESKMRWNTLPCIDWTVNKETGILAILDKLNIKSEIKDTIPNPAEEVISKGLADENKTKNPVLKKDIIPSIDEKTSVISNDELLNDLSDGFEYYRFKLNNQISSSYYGLGALIAASIVLLIGLYFWDGLEEFMQKGQEKLKYLGTVGGLIPSTLSTFSISKIKEKKKRRDGIEDFERVLSRMKKGLVPNSKQHIIELEDEFIKYTKS
jgi:hypothetical protein